MSFISLMDVTRFTNEKTGQLIPITLIENGLNEADTAFIPDPMPVNWSFPESLWPLLCEANQELSRLDGMAQTLPNPQLLLSPLRRQESLTSSRLEGTYATEEELLLFELEPRAPTSERDPANAWTEVRNYNNSLAKGYFALEKIPFCLRLLKDLHETLMGGVRGGNRNPGNFRDHQVHIGSNRRYIPPPPAQMIEALYGLEKYLNDPTDNLNPLVRCFIAHYQFEAIHPFSDGNGRIGRVLLSLMIYKWCGLKMPWLYVSSYFERYKDEYIDNLFRISTHGDWSRWIEFCLNGVIRQSKSAFRKCEQLKSLKEEMCLRVLADRPRTHAIIEMLFDSPILRASDIKERLGGSHNTAQKDLDFLVDKEILRRITGIERPKTYVASEILSIANSEDH